MSNADFVAWGWRVFFFAGFFVAIVGIIIRNRTEESFVFERHREEEALLSYPANRVWQEMPLRILAHFPG